MAAILSLLAYINLALGLFNLIPGLPLDGGNILKAVVWQVTGNPIKGFYSLVVSVNFWLVSDCHRCAINSRNHSIWQFLDAINWHFPPTKCWLFRSIS